MSSAQKRVLVTGFDAFDKLDVNPSQTIVETLGPSILLPGRRSEVLLERLVLPTCCKKSWEKLKRKLDAGSGGFDAVILTGVAATRQKISLERFALNIRDYRIEDNCGHQYFEEPVERHGPDAVQTSLSLKSISDKLLKSGVICEVSNHAGTFVCNEIYYKCLRYQHNQPNPAEVLFVHLPLPKVYKRRWKETPRKSTQHRFRESASGINLMIDAVERIIKFAVQ